MLCVLAATVASAYDIVSGESRTALVIGNANYRASPLRNPVNDAEAVAAALRPLGFQVILRANATQRELLEAMREFSQRAAKSQVRLVFYAGHGVQLRGRNYLVPVDADISTEDDIVQRGVDVTEILERHELRAQLLRSRPIFRHACLEEPAARARRA